MSSSLRDNRPSRGSVGEYLREQIVPGTQLSFVSAYFTVNAYDALKSELESAESLRFLFGEPSFISEIDSEKDSKKNFKLTEDGLELAHSLKQRPAAKACAEWIRRMVEIRSIRQSGFLHGKAYHIQNLNASSAILGSSNFTVPGLGLRQSGNNIELNLVVDSDRDRNDLRAWFEEVWDDDSLSKDVKSEVLRYLERLYANHSPEFIYYLTLYHVFREELEGTVGIDDSLKRTTLLESNIWKMLFSFQKDGVKGAINKILEYNGCILADSVGLGKTFEALAVIKYFELRNERVLVICPKKLRQNWTVYRSNSRLNPLLDDSLAFDVLSHTDLSREGGMSGDINLATQNWGNYGLIVIDESHNFRNNAVGKEKEDGSRRRSRYERLMEDVIQSGLKTKVLLLSATPVNNQIADIRNQISLIAGGDVARSSNPAFDAAFQDKLGVPSVKETTRQAQSKFTTWTKRPPEQRKTRDLIHQLGSDFFKLLDGLSIARSRAQIKRYYAKELATLGGFPDRDKPQAEYPEIDAQNQFLNFQQLDDQISSLTLSLYHPSSYLRKNLPQSVLDQYAQRIGNFTQEGRERILISMMKVNFLKRLESSIDSFRSTLARTIQKIDDLKAKIENFQKAKIQNPAFDFANLSDEDFDDLDFDPEDLKIGGKHKINLEHLNLPDWKLAISKDRDQLQYLLDHAEPITPNRDAKLLRLKDRVSKKLENPSINKEGESIRKVIVFTAFSDTARYLWDNLAEPLHQKHGTHAALISGGGANRTTLGKSDFEHILTNFSPRSKGRDRQPELPQDQEIDLLIATDCISEGQNLQDCDLLINYDIHWNPVRIIQRFGRIDRIGSRNKRVSLVNFWPTKDLDSYLNVKHRVEARMALVDLTASGEDNLLNSEQFQDLIEADLHYRNKQLKRLQNEILDLEDLDEETISLADFSLADFRLDLLRFLESNREALETAPLGLYAVVPPDPKIPAAQPGILFCFRQRNDRRPTEVNPLAPHYLVYVLDDGNVRLTFAQPKQSLEVFRALAASQSTALDGLCDLFDDRTGDGTTMKHENLLLERAVESIKATFGKRAASTLFSSRDGKLPSSKDTPSSSADLELVTWLVIANN
ncbi:Helicase conserved C-terminal domain protein [Verrucomicrobiia bacterium DG1235]|nr:Helicase conserved C-terminal domain protein [Verrucomicrobiae bacterium DG1235]